MIPTDFISIFGTISMLVDRLAFIFLSIYFGSLAFKGWKGRKNIIFKTVSIIVLGLICFVGGLTLKEIFGLDFFMSDYVFSIIVAVILAIVVRLISSGFKIKEKYVTKKDISSLSEDVKVLKIQVAKLTKALEDKKMMPPPLEEEDVKKALTKGLEKKGIKKYEYIKCEKQEDVWLCEIKSKKGRRSIVVDAYTGSIASMEKINSPWEFLYKKPFATTGIVIFLGLIIFLGLNMSLATINVVSEAFDFSFLFPEPLPVGCISASIALSEFEATEISVSPNSSAISLALPSDQYLIDSMTQGIRTDGSTYYLATTYTSQISSLSSVITTSTLGNIRNAQVCVLTSDYTLCDCIGEEFLDPAITAPYFMSIGVLEEAIQNAILTSVSGMFGGMG